MDYNFTIFCYWEDEELPPLIKKCLETWKKINKFKIIVLNKNNYKNYVNYDDYKNIDRKFCSVTKFTDYLRFDLINKYGGIWMDISIIVLKDLNWIEQFNYNVIFNNTINMKDGEICMESWFFSAKKGNPLIKLIRDDIFSIKVKNDEDKYIEDTIKDNIIIPNNICYHYHLIYLIMSRNIQKNKNLLNDFKVIDCNNGYGFSHIVDKDSYKKILNYYSFRSKDDLKLIKLTNMDRKLYEDDNKKEIFDKYVFENNIAQSENEKNRILKIIESFNNINDINNINDKEYFYIIEQFLNLENNNNNDSNYKIFKENFLLILFLILFFIFYLHKNI